MIAAPDILLLAEGPLAERLTRPLPPDAVNVRPEPFAALEALAKRPYRVVLLTAPQPDLGQLASAIRRLQPDARILGLCHPADEPELLAIDRATLEDYYILPLAPREWRGILQSEALPETPQASPASLSSEQTRRLIDAARDGEALAGCLETMVAEVCGAGTGWAELDAVPASAHAVLLLETPTPRVLWADAPLETDARHRRWFSALREIVPSLAALAGRVEALHRLATIDDLTGLYNRRYFLHFAQQLLQRAQRQRFRVTLLLYDIDDFKRYNDQFGHAVGDEILHQTARMMRSITRKHDVVARVGGDEFAVLFWEAGPPRQPNSQPPQSAYALADRFRQAVNSHRFDSLGPDARGVLTISGGLASFPWDGRTVEELLKSADDALLSAKRCGKNNIRIVGDFEDE